MGRRPVAFTAEVVSRIPDRESRGHWTSHPATDTAAAGWPRAVDLYWLGQAGFLIDVDGRRLVIDPYLSDTLARKYRDSRFPHKRMMPPPVHPSSLTDVNWVFSTHHHTDHLDPGTLPLIAESSPGARFIVPEAAAATAVERGVPDDRMITCNVGDRLELEPEVVVHVVPAAHEERRRDESGRDVFVGYVLELGDVVLYHAGDTVPFAELEEFLRRHVVTIALLPVNGRDAARRANGVPGNMTLDEALDLAERLGVPYFVGHHFDLFDFNTIDRAWGEARIRERFPERTDDYLLAATGLRYRLSLTG